ncbi:MAG: HXXEE domain-containing protein [Methanobacterium sp.]
MEWIFLLILIVSIIHVIEEYFGGFIKQMKQNVPEKFATAVDLSQFVSVNLTFLILCFIAVIVGSSNLVYSLSVATILFINVFTHIGGAIRLRGYNAGLISALLLYLPVSVYAYYYYRNIGAITQIDIFLSIALGVVLMIFLLINLFIQSYIKKAEQE